MPVPTAEAVERAAAPVSVRISLLQTERSWWTGGPAPAIDGGACPTGGMPGRDRRRAGAGRAQAHEAVAQDETVEISVVMPCLNEEDSVGICVKKAWEGIRLTGRTGEVIVADNGSTDGSVGVAQEAGARVVHQPARATATPTSPASRARGSIIVMGDSDDSYDFTVFRTWSHRSSSRATTTCWGRGSTGEMEQGAMPWSHRYIGNPVLTTFLNVLFKLRVSDAHSGFRVFTRDGARADGLAV